MRSTSQKDTPPRLSGKIVALDVEASGLDPHHGGRIFCWAYITEKGEYGFMRKTAKSLRWIQQLFDDSTKTVIFHHAKFDLKMFSFEGIDIFNIKATVHCTLILSKVLRSTDRQHDLRYLSIKYLSRNPKHKDEVVEWIKKHKKVFIREHDRSPNFSDAPIKLIKNRALWDVESTLLLFKFLYPRVQKTCPELYATEQQLMFVCIDMENTGVLVDISKAKELRTQAIKDVQRIQRDLNKLVCPITVKRKKKGELIEEVRTELNPSSSALELPAAFKKLRIPLKYKTKPKKGKKGGAKSGGGNWSFDEYAMIRYVSKPLASIIRDSGEEGWPAAKFYKAIYAAIKKHKLHKRELLPPLVLKYRELTKMVSTYYDNIIALAVDVHETPAGREVGTLHCKFNQSEAMTGRFSSSEINLQNQPRLLGPRECFIPRRGRWNWHLDYDQVEMKFFVHFARDKKMAAAIEDDIHRAVASEIYNLPEKKITKEQRKRAKGTNFGIIYGSGPATQAETLTKKGLPTSTQEATIIVGNYHRKFPSVKQTINDLKVELHRNGYVANPFGRRYYIPSEFGYKCLNYLCQGTSADLMKRAMVEIWTWLRKKGMKAKILMTVHDELVIECSQRETPIIIPAAMKMMQDLHSYFVGVTVSAEVNKTRWSNKEDSNKLGFNFNGN